MNLFGSKKKELPMLQVPTPKKDLPEIPNTEDFTQERISIGDLLYKDVQQIGKGLNTIYEKILELEERQAVLQDTVNNMKMLNITIKGEDEKK